MCSHSLRGSLNCVVPPHMLRTIAERGTPRQRAAAVATLATDATFRALRASGLLAVKPFAAAPLAAQRSRTICTAGNQQLLPGAVVASEAAPPAGADAAVREAFEGLGATWNFFWEVYDRNSIDDQGLALEATVHYGDGYNNAFWNGARMVFGDGDGQMFNRFTCAIDIIGHELAHGVTEDEAGLVYMFQSGALNESMSDVFGSLIKQWVGKQTAAEADWLIGAGLFTSAIKGRALRSMQAPGTAYDDPVLGRDPQPAHMDAYVDTYDDHGGVHINSGIPNHAFYLTATRLGGYAWDRAGRIWYETLRDSALKPNTEFRRFARLTIDTAARLYGPGSIEKETVQSAWSDVGVNVAVPATATV